MNTGIVGRHIDLTDSIKDYINSSVEVFKKYNLDNLQEFKENFKLFKLFETKEELELYKNNINSFLNTKI